MSTRMHGYLLCKNEVRYRAQDLLHEKRMMLLILTLDRIQVRVPTIVEPYIPRSERDSSSVLCKPQVDSEKLSSWQNNLLVQLNKFQLLGICEGKIRKERQAESQTTATSSKSPFLFRS